MIRHLITIGGGEIGRTKTMPDGSIKQYHVETLEIDKKAIALTGKQSPNLLVIATANHNNEDYYNVVKHHFEQRLKCKVSLLNDKADIMQQINLADAIYISGGDTRHMLSQWSKTGLDKALLQAYNLGKVIIGYSAGAICWFNYYDNFDYKNEENFKPGLLQGLGLLTGTMIPHYNNVAKEQVEIIESLTKDKKSKLYKVNNAQAIFWQNEKPLF